MNQVHRGFRKVTVDSDSKDEVGTLIRSFKRMMEELNKLISEVYEAKIELQHTEMRALQAQINPHFLYNSLSIINWKAIEAEEDEISMEKHWRRYPLQQENILIDQRSQTGQ